MKSHADKKIKGIENVNGVKNHNPVILILLLRAVKKIMEKREA